jgi:hypothetical protein
VAHPIERLRSVARAEGADPSLVAVEAASALVGVARADPAGLLPACRRLISRHLWAGPVWWLSARVLGAPDVAAEARAAAGELEADTTSAQLAAALPDDATVLVVGWPELAATALRRRGDVEALLVDAGGEGAALARRLVSAGGDATAVPDRGDAAAAVVADVVVVEALAAGPSGVLAAPGSHAAAAVAAGVGTPTWVVAGVGRVLPERLWESLLTRFDALGEPWERPAELVPAHLLSLLVGPDGLRPTDEGLADPSCAPAPELLRDAG